MSSALLARTPSSSSSSIISTTAHAAAHDTGFPPKVEPWSPGANEPAAASLDEKRSDRKAVRKALGERHEVWPHAELLEGKERPGAPDPGLNLVEAEKRRQSRCRLDELVLERNHSAFAEYRLEQNQTDLVVDGCDECTDVVRLDEAYAGHEWDEWLALRRLPGCRQRAESPAVEATFESNDTESSGCLACVLERRFDGLGTRVAEERLSAAEAVGQERRELLGRLCPIEVRRMPETLELRPRCSQRDGVKVPERHHGDAASEIEVCAAVCIPDPGAFPSHQHEVRARVGRHEPLEPSGSDIGRNRAHATTAVAPISTVSPSRAARTAARSFGTMPPSTVPLSISSVA